MSEIAETTTTVQSEEIIRPQHSGELQNIQAAYRLDGKNYLKWSQLVRTVLKGKGKISHLMGTGPKLGDPHFEAWDEEDSMIMAWVIKTKCPEDAAILKDFIEQDRVYDFLVGLNPEFDQVRIQILGKQEVPCFNELAMVAGSGNNSATNMERVLVSGNGRSSQPKTQNRDYKDNLWCTYCKKARHTRERCWKLHGKPPSREWGQKGEQPSNNGQAHVTTVQQNEATPQETGSLNQEEVERVRSLICNLDKPQVLVHWRIQDEDSGRMIGHARERDGLYYLKAPSQSNITKGKSSHSFVSEPEPVPENPKSAPENVRFDKVFSRKKTVVPESVQVQDFNPNSENEALTDEKWKQAMNVEMEALEKNKTWELVKLPTGKKPVGCKWVYTVKYKADGSIERYKARLVAKGYTQTYGIDYQETFAPVAKMNTVRVLLSLAANYNWDLQQFDVKNVFLHGELEEEIYMEVPPGYDNNLAAHTVCKLKKALYGLKQSPRAWFGRFARVMITMGYRQSQGDHTLFIKHSSSGKLTALLVYVDDIIVTGNDEERQVLNQCLAKEFEIKALGRLKYFLGIEVAHSKQGIFISQQKYVKIFSKKLERRMQTSKLIYLSHTRPDIAYAVSMISQFMHSPKEAHLQVAYRVLQYLKGTPGKGILFKRNGGLVLEAYTDADYAGSIIDRSAEAEFRAMAQGVCELLWLKIVLEDLKIKWDGPMRLYCDNKSAISIAHNPVQHDRTKHIEIDRHFIKEKLDSGLICTPYVSTHGQLADILTKGLSSSCFKALYPSWEW
ncbi:Retrovirus-related Pol polyprotein from transposon RE1 [Vitis vinifera]|uniref:Retrovirus-related Pol polyprotein from transposon RE1 n=1 Tax=Vitis vinifera TaxID=29760 RepID=A0A438G2U0_VITVI|nr:Retrovirus-related Pol polyprotein from transposon RE1 [Vitis vinifera]